MDLAEQQAVVMQRLSLPVSSRCVHRLHPLRWTPCSGHPALPSTPTACSAVLHVAGLRSKRRAQLLYSGPSDVQQPSAVADALESQSTSPASPGSNGINGQSQNGHHVAATAAGTAEPGGTETEPEYILFTAADLAANDQQYSSNGVPPEAVAVLEGATAVTLDPTATVDAADEQQQQQGQHSPAAAANDLAANGGVSREQHLTDQQQQQQPAAAIAQKPDQDSSAATTDIGDSEIISSPLLNSEPLKIQDSEEDLSSDHSHQQQRVPPPLIDPNVDILNDPSFAIRLMDILDQITSSSAAASSLQSTKVGTG